MTARMILLDAKPLGAADVAEIARRSARLMLGEEAMRRIRASRALIEHLTELGKPMYGVTTGLGACVDTPLAQADLIASSTACRSATAWASALLCRPRRCGR